MIANKCGLRAQTNETIRDQKYYIILLTEEKLNAIK